MIHISILFICFTLNSNDNYCNTYIDIDAECKSILTTQVLQQYQAPVNILQKFKDMKYTSSESLLIQDHDLYLKSDLSRIVGHMRLKQLITQEQFTNFGVPTKYLVPKFDKNSELDFKTSYVISMIAPGKFVKFWKQNEIEQLLHIANNSGVVDFYYANIKRDNDGKNWLIDTQLDRYNENPEYRAAQHILKNIETRVLDYRLDEDSIQYLKDIIKRYE